MVKHDLIDRILDARTFAISLRAKHPSSFERGASGQGVWWGFPGDYGILEPADLEMEANFSAVALTDYRSASELPLRCMCTIFQPSKRCFIPLL